MLIPVGEDIAVQVTVVVLAAEPVIWTAVLCRLDADLFRLRITSPEVSPPAVGTRLILNAGERTKLAGRVVAIEDEILVVSREQAHATDDRAAPRVVSRLELRWRMTKPSRAGAGVESEAWLAGGTDPGPFVTYRGAANLSMSGLRFPCRGPTPESGSQVLVGVQLRGDPSLSGAGPTGVKEYRALGAVRRKDPEGDAIAVAIEFLELPEPTFDALSEFTLHNL